MCLSEHGSLSTMNTIWSMKSCSSSFANKRPQEWHETRSNSFSSPREAGIVPMSMRLIGRSLLEVHLRMLCLLCVRQTLENLCRRLKPFFATAGILPPYGRDLQDLFSLPHLLKKTRLHRSISTRSFPVRRADAYLCRRMFHTMNFPAHLLPKAERI